MLGWTEWWIAQHGLRLANIAMRIAARFDLLGRPPTLRHKESARHPLYSTRVLRDVSDDVYLANIGHRGPTRSWQSVSNRYDFPLDDPFTSISIYLLWLESSRAYPTLGQGIVPSNHSKSC
jgi:hypothetical protein